MKRLVLPWPATILLSTIAAGLVYFVFTSMAIRPLIVMWFLFVCPGMSVIRLLHLNEAIVEWTLAIALSFTLDAIIASIQLYAQLWSPTATFVILIVLCLGGAVAQIVTERGVGGSLTQKNESADLRYPSSAELDGSVAPFESPVASHAASRISQRVDWHRRKQNS